MPLPDWLGPFRPDLALLAVIYWILTSPRIAGLGYAWLAGLVLDVLRGMTLGQHALGFVLVAFVGDGIRPNGGGRRRLGDPGFRARDQRRLGQRLRHGGRRGGAGRSAGQGAGDSVAAFLVQRPGRERDGLARLQSQGQGKA